MAFSILFCTTALVFLLFHISHYPLTISLLSFCLVRTIIDAKIEKVIIWEDRFEIVTRHLFPFLTKRQVVLF